MSPAPGRRVRATRLALASARPYRPRRRDPEDATAFPRKFEALLETKLPDVEAPDYACLTYAVCGCEEDACGWGGGVLEAVFKADGADHPTSTGDRVLESDERWTCPRCTKPLFRTRASVRVETTGPIPPARFDYETAPMEYED